MENFNERTNTAIELAKIAGIEIKRILHDEDIHTTGKGLNDVVTIADVKSEKIIAGHTLFSYNTKTKEIKVAPIQYSKDVDFMTKTALHKPKIVIEPFCVYRQALNKRNFVKRLKREGIID